MEKIIQNHLTGLELLKEPEIVNKIDRLKDKIFETLNLGNNIFLCGNGGSASNSQHFANDFYFINNKKKIFKRICIEALISNPAVVTCISNDLSYEEVYSYQLSNKAKEDDLLICLSGSGNSMNLIKAANIAKQKNIFVASITGFDGGKLHKISDLSIQIPINDMQVAEDCQLVICHVITKKLLLNEE